MLGQIDWLDTKRCVQDVDDFAEVLMSVRVTALLALLKFGCAGSVLFLIFHNGLYASFTGNMLCGIVKKSLETCLHFSICIMKRRGIRKFYAARKKSLICAENKSRFFSCIHTHIVRSSTELISIKYANSLHVTGAEAAKMLKKEFCKNYLTETTAAEIDKCNYNASSHADEMYINCTMFDIIHALDNGANTADGPHGVFLQLSNKVCHSVVQKKRRTV